MRDPAKLLLMGVASLGFDVGDELIFPCMCKGTQQFVHRSCLDHWRSVKEGSAFSHCTTCKARFHLRVDVMEEDFCHRLKFRLFVARDVFLMFVAIQAAIAAIGVMAYFLDKDGKFRNSFTDDWDRFLSKHPVPFYYCVGICRRGSSRGLHTTKDGSRARAAPEDVAALVASTSANDGHIDPFGAYRTLA